MMKNNTENDLYDSVVKANEGITRKDVKSMFIWYDLLSFVLPFQLIFLFTYLIGSNYYPFTICSILCIFVMDAFLKGSLEKDGKNYQKFSKYISLVKLWAIPLVCMGVVTTISLLITTLGLI